MDRRLVGVALLAATVLVLAVAHAVSGWSLPGKGHPAALPPAPTTGSCLGPMSDVQRASPIDDVEAVPCADPHAAEIFLVGTISDEDYPISSNTQTLTGTAEFRRAQRVCHDAARRYLGEFDDNAQWRVPPQEYTKVSVPSKAAWNIGQRWFSCQAIARVGEPAAFVGTISGSRSATRPPAILGTCSDRVEGQHIACTQPHRYEELALLPVPNWRRPDLTGSTFARPTCVQLAAGIIGRSDPTFGGRLAITDHREPAETSCWAGTTDGSAIAGSLIGHGDQPLTGG